MYRFKTLTGDKFWSAQVDMKDAEIAVWVVRSNIVHRWLRESARQALAGPAPAFVAVTLDEPPPVAPAPVCPPPAPEPDIRVEVRRANASIVVKWPLAGGAACAAWLSGWLR